MIHNLNIYHDTLNGVKIIPSPAKKIVINCTNYHNMRPFFHKLTNNNVHTFISNIKFIQIGANMYNKTLLALGSTTHMVLFNNVINEKNKRGDNKLAILL